MNEPRADQASGQASAGALLRAARERSGMHLGLLSATLKVPVRKLELLESDRFEELHDATFVRALALSVCRVLKCDPAPILGALPRLDAYSSMLVQVREGGSESFSQRSSAPVVLRSAADRRGWWWTLTLLLVLATALWWVPASWAPWHNLAPGAAHIPWASTGNAGEATVAQPSGATASGALTSASPSSTGTVVQTVHGAPSESAASTAPGMDSAVSVTEPSWVEATDLQGLQIWARTLTPGEVVSLDKGGGLKLTIGNAAATRVRWRGRDVDLSTSTRDNVARVELK
ncbi:MAG: helix-turn-helix domain-containing protein [Betaproteobacteria bacterium]